MRVSPFSSARSRIVSGPLAIIIGLGSAAAATGPAPAAPTPTPAPSTASSKPTTEPTRSGTPISAAPTSTPVTRTPTPPTAPTPTGGPSPTRVPSANATPAPTNTPSPTATQRPFGVYIDGMMQRYSPVSFSIVPVPDGMTASVRIHETGQRAVARRWDDDGTWLAEIDAPSGGWKPGIYHVTASRSDGATADNGFTIFADTKSVTGTLGVPTSSTAPLIISAKPLTKDSCSIAVHRRNTPPAYDTYLGSPACNPDRNGYVSVSFPAPAGGWQHGVTYSVGITSSSQGFVWTRTFTLADGSTTRPTDKPSTGSGSGSSGQKDTAPSAGLADTGV